MQHVEHEQRATRSREGKGARRRHREAKIVAEARALEEMGGQADGSAGDQFLTASSRSVRETGGKVTPGRVLQGNPRRPYTILRLPAVKEDSGLSRSTIYVRISQGLWTKAVSLGPRCVGWPAQEVQALIGARIAGKTDEEIRTLVLDLEAARKGVAQ